MDSLYQLSKSNDDIFIAAMNDTYMYMLCDGICTQQVVCISQVEASEHVKQTAIYLVDISYVDESTINRRA